MNLLSRTSVPIALAVTAAIGILLRLSLAGATELPGEFANLRHAHSHAGVYALYVPLTFVAWRALGVPTPGRRTLTLYSLASIVAIAVFAAAGYVVASIAASTVVGVTWLYAAFLARHVVRREAGAVRIYPIAFLVATFFVPPIAIATGRDPALGQRLAHTFLAVLFLLVMLPVAFRRVGGRSLDARLYVPAAALVSVHLGAAPSAPGALGLILLGGLVGYGAATARLPLAHRLSWGGFAFGTIGLSVIQSPPHDLAVGGLHYLLLGPLFASLVPLGPRGTVAVTAAAGLMAAYLSSPMLGTTPRFAHGGAAIAGTLWALAASIAVISGWKKGADPSPPPGV